MASDALYFRGQTRTAVHDIASSDDASGNGVEVLAAPAAGVNLYAMGWVYHNASVGALTFTLARGAGAVGATAIGAPITVAAGATVYVNYSIPLAAGAAATNIGVITSGAGQVEVEVWGYYTT